MSLLPQSIPTSCCILVFRNHSWSVSHFFASVMDDNRYTPISAERSTIDWVEPVPSPFSKPVPPIFSRATLESNMPPTAKRRGARRRQPVADKSSDVELPDPSPSRPSAKKRKVSDRLRRRCPCPHDTHTTVVEKWHGQIPSASNSESRK